MKTTVEILHEVPKVFKTGAYQLCFQKCTYHYSNRPSENGFRFIWRRDNGKLQPARGQARIPSKQELESLLNQATAEGWYK